MPTNFLSYYPYAYSFPELWVRYLFAAVVYLLLGIASWLLFHKFIFKQDWKAFGAALVASAAMIIWPLAILPYLRFVSLVYYLAVTMVGSGVLLTLNLALWKKAGRIHFKGKGLAWRALAAVATVTLIGVSAYTLLEYSADAASYQKTISHLEEAERQLTSPQTEAAEKVEELANGASFVNLFKQKDFSKLTELTKEALAGSELVDAIAVTDKDGIVVVAPHSSLLIGQDLTTLGPGHVKVLQGEAAKTFELGITSPIVVGAGTPIKENGAVIGAVFAAKLVNQNFLLEIAGKFGEAELGLYCNCNKLYLATFQNQDSAKAMQNFAELAFTDENLIERDVFRQNVSTDGKKYTASGKFLKNSFGDVLRLLVVFEPYPDKELSDLLAASGILVFLTSLGVFISPLIAHRFIR